MFLLFNRNLIFSTLLLFSLIRFTFAERLCFNEEYKNGVLTSNAYDEACSTCVGYICKYGADFYTGEICEEKMSSLCADRFVPDPNSPDKFIVFKVGRYVMVNQPEKPDPYKGYRYFNSLFHRYISDDINFADDSMKSNYFWLELISLGNSDTLKIKKEDYASWAEAAKSYLNLKLTNWTDENNNAQSKVYEMAKKVGNVLEHNIEDIKKAATLNSSFDHFEKFGKNFELTAKEYEKQSFETILNQRFKLNEVEGDEGRSINALQDPSRISEITEIHYTILQNVAQSESKVLYLTKRASEIIQNFNDQMAEIENAGNEARKALSNVENSSNGKKIAQFQVAFIFSVLAFIHFVF